MCQKYLRKLQLQHPSAFVYKIDDSPVSRKPFDSFVLLDGSFTAIEFKVGRNPLEAHQKRALLEVKAAGGKAKLIVFTKEGEIEKEEDL